MKRILVLSDLHIPSSLKKFPSEILKPYITKADMIFGLGDYTTQAGINFLFGFNKEIHLVSGNMDDHIVKSQLPVKLKIKVEDVNIGLIHGWGAPYGLREKIFKEFNDVDLICYGHTHSSYFKKENGIYFFNPGSICGQNPSFGILTINKNKIKSNIINF
jgi:putative phosphoesterase